MKKRLMILFAIATVASGCRHIPSWMLQGHVDGYNDLHPGETIEVSDDQGK